MAMHHEFVKKKLGWNLIEHSVKYFIIFLHLSFKLWLKSWLIGSKDTQLPRPIKLILPHKSSRIYYLQLLWKKIIQTFLGSNLHQIDLPNGQPHRRYIRDSDIPRHRLPAFSIS